MGLTLNTRDSDGSIIVEAIGQITAGEACVRFQEFTNRLVSGGGRLCAIDMAGVTFIDSAGLGALLSIYTTAKLDGGGFRLMNLGPNIKEALTITNLIQIFEIAD